MNELKSYWRLMWSDVDYPSLAAAKHAARLWISEDDLPWSLSGFYIWHWLNDSIISSVEIKVSDKGRVSFSKPYRI